MAKNIRLRKGYDIKLVGNATKEWGTYPEPQSFAVKPLNFKGLIPKMVVEPGAEVKAGTPLFVNKANPDMVFVSPVSGEVAEVVRGEKRVILEVRILADKDIKYHQNQPLNIDQASVSEIKSFLLRSGAWPWLRQRPYNILANPEIAPKNIFVSGFDSNPLAPEYDFVLSGRENHLKTGFKLLTKLTTGKVYLGLNAKAPSKVLEQAASGLAQINYFEGPHPAGNVGVQIHHTAPINKGDTVWTINPQDLANLGKLCAEGVYDASKGITVAGSEVQKPNYLKVVAGANVKTMLTGNLNENKVRIISGSVLFGDQIPADGYFGFYDQQITVIPEGDEPEFFGWLLPSYPRPSISKTYLSPLLKDRKYKVNTSMHGEERAFVVTNEYEKVLPMDILPVQLIKACMANDLEAMEQLGIYEVVEEDLSLCEFVCTSKIPVQEILSEGLQLIEKEG